MRSVSAGAFDFSSEPLRKTAPSTLSWSTTPDPNTEATGGVVAPGVGSTRRVFAPSRVTNAPAGVIRTPLWSDENSRLGSPPPRVSGPAAPRFGAIARRLNVFAPSVER